jgi:hypothetical protein
MNFFKSEEGKWKWFNLAGVSIMIALLILVILIAVFHEPKESITNTNTVVVIKEPYFVPTDPVQTYVYNNYYAVEGNDTSCNAYALDSGKGVVLACKTK